MNEKSCAIIKIMNEKSCAIIKIMNKKSFAIMFDLFFFNSGTTLR